MEIQKQKRIKGVSQCKFALRLEWSKLPLFFYFYFFKLPLKCAWLDKQQGPTIGLPLWLSC